MARRAGDIRREEILRATIEVIRERGLAGVRVADVAAALGVSTALVFYHFDSKERLVAEAFDLAARADMERLDAVLAAADPPSRKLSRVISLYAPAGSGSSWPIWIEAWASAVSEPEIRRTWRALDRRWRDGVRDILREGVAAGDFTCPDPVASSWRIIALLDGLALQNVVNTKAPKRRTLLAYARQAAATEAGVAAEALA